MLQHAMWTPSTLLRVTASSSSMTSSRAIISCVLVLRPAIFSRSF
jgi:hypothetical protein